jgi:hypothetical protein
VNTAAVATIPGRMNERLSTYLPIIAIRELRGHAGMAPI